MAPLHDGDLPLRNGLREACRAGRMQVEDNVVWFGSLGRCRERLHRCLQAARVELWEYLLQSWELVDDEVTSTLLELGLDLRNDGGEGGLRDDAVAGRPFEHVREGRYRVPG